MIPHKSYMQAAIHLQRSREQLAQGNLVRAWDELGTARWYAGAGIKEIHDRPLLVAWCRCAAQQHTALAEATWAAMRPRGAA